MDTPFATDVIPPPPPLRIISPGNPEFLPALHFVLRVPFEDHAATSTAVGDLLAAEKAGRLRLSPVYTDNTHHAVLNVLSPGASALLMLSRVRTAAPSGAMTACLQQAASFAQNRGCKLLEVLLDPGDIQDAAWHQPLARAGFHFLTHLIYLYSHCEHTTIPPNLLADVEWVNYSDSTHPLFLRVLEESYHGTLDCAELSGWRTTEEVLAGHRASGEFDPVLWWVALRSGSPVGVLLLHRLRNRAMEIAYLGAAQVVRGTGVANALVARALAQRRDHGATMLALAVDERNHPARRLYGRWGFRMFERRAVWIATGAQTPTGTDVGAS